MSKKMQRKSRLYSTRKFAVKAWEAVLLFFTEKINTPPWNEDTRVCVSEAGIGVIGKYDESVDWVLVS